jgi:glycosyltransferase involved in cell wall biosynthesis
MSPAYGVGLRQLAEELAPGAVHFESGITRERLAEHYRAASAFLCLSEHEGFCIPLLEAFHFGVPVIARDVGAIAEVVGDAGVLLSEQDNLAVVAELLRVVVEDQELRAELRARGERRLEVYEYARTAEALREAMLSVSSA